ncbi:MAG: DUF6431 domain-containing protein [Thermaerobacter sp.]|nr:DUF6431 domain-containing protein [Thermaerobacter sp.]
MSRCPLCEASLTVIGSRPRTRRPPDGTRQILVIRRLRCAACRRIHHELPDCLVPYKRYDAESLETFAMEGRAGAIAADESTLQRWEAWFRAWFRYVNGCWTALDARQPQETGEAPPFPAVLPRRAPWPIGAAPGWLARVVRRLVEAALWRQTRSALVT